MIFGFSSIFNYFAIMPNTDDENLTVTVASKVSFTELCGLLEKISKTSGNDKKKRVLKDFVQKWRNFHDELHSKSNDTNDSFYPAMRLLLPHLDKERLAYGIKEHMLAKLMIEVLCLGKDSPDATRLLNYKSPKNARADAGDFASVAYFVLKNRCPEKGTLTIEEVNSCLDSIATNNAAKKKDEVRKNILHLLKNLSAMEQKWLIRMIVKELKVGLSQASILSVYHPDAEELYNVNNNIEKVCRLMRDPSVRVHEIGISIFSPFTPMLGERASPDKVKEKLMDGYFIETKFDGCYSKNENDFIFISSGNEYTHIFGATPFDGTFTPYIANCFKPGVKTCILDGEVLGYHAASKTYGTKAEQFDVKSKDLLETKGYQPCLNVFDILLFNDKVLTNLPLRERLLYIDKVFNPIEGRIMVSTHTEAKTNQDCADALNEAIDNQEEGILVKNPESVYRPNTRKGGWFKIKPEYIGGLMDELDVLIVGGYFGVGHRGGMMSHFLCAVAVPPEDGEKPSVFHSFCKVGSGYTKKQLSEFNLKLAEHWKVFDKKNPPSCVVLASGFKEKPDAWIEPSNSCIVQIKAAEIIESDRFKTGFTLRFPRVEHIRHDKPWFECMTAADVEDLKQKSGGKLTGGKFELGDSGGEPVKKKRKIVSRFERPTLMNQFKAADVSKVQQVSKMFENKEFCVINGPLDHPKHELEKKVVEFGGTIVQNPGSNTFCVLVEKVAVRVNNLKKRDIYDIVKVSWFLKCVDAQRWMDWTPDDMIHTSPKTHKLFQQDYDEYGDSFTSDTTEEQLLKVFEKMENAVQDVSTWDIAELEDKYFPDESPYGLFRTCRIYLDNNLVVSDATTRIPNCSLDLLGLELRFFGATITDKLDADVSHAIVEVKDVSRLQQLRDVRRRRTKKFHIVTEAWVRACLEDGELCTERIYEPK
ncbi:DNA ligase 4-like [Gigantopelta aegis]|uniref:DNA ligase 4-like n=1 Tax=Gigantopelta aegis TaxID=1735272 RepID=UPI001B88BEFE|nr:DNA ligase 4-like [Gigantopelta aegis]